MDRVLGLVSYVRYEGDTLDMFERLPGDTVNVEIDLSKVFAMKSGRNSSSLVPVSQASPGVNKEKEDEELECLH